GHVATDEHLHVDGQRRSCVDDGPNAGHSGLGGSRPGGDNPARAAARASIRHPRGHGGPTQPVAEHAGMAGDRRLGTGRPGLGWRWRPAVEGRERVGGSFRHLLVSGLRFALDSRELMAIVARVSLFFGSTSALIALLPLVAQHMHGSTASTYPLLMAALGSGA